MRGLGEHAGLGLRVGLSHPLPKPRDTAALWFNIIAAQAFGPLKKYHRWRCFCCFKKLRM